MKVGRQVDRWAGGQGEKWMPGVGLQVTGVRRISGIRYLEINSP